MARVLGLGSSNPHPSGLLLNAIWNSGTGNGKTALQTAAFDDPDGDGCDAVWPAVLSVGAAAGGWTLTPNALSICSTSTGCGHLRALNLFAAPSPGDFWVFRWYVQNGASQLKIHQHPFCLNSVGNIQGVLLNIEPTVGGGGNWIPGFSMGTNVPDINGVGKWNGRNPAGGADYIATAATWYMFEMIVAHLNPVSTRRVYPRLWSLAGAVHTLVLDVNDWRYSNFPNPRLQDWYATPGYHDLGGGYDAALVRTPGWGIGESGGLADGHFIYVGAVAAKYGVSSSDFIGAYA